MQELHMKNNTIAIALASLLVGGVATAGYMNSRDAAGRGNDTVPHAVDAAVPAAADRAAAGDVLPDAAIPAAGRLEYAEVVAVEPVLERETLYAERHAHHINDETLRALVGELDLSEVSLRKRLAAARRAAGVGDGGHPAR